MTDHTSALVALLAALDARVTVHDGIGSNPAPGPRLHVYGGQQTPENRSYGHTAPNRGTIWQVVCVSNTQVGARNLSRRVTDTLDSRLLGGSLLRVRFVSQPIEDRDDPSEWRWSSTVEVTHHI